MILRGRLGQRWFSQGEKIKAKRVQVTYLRLQKLGGIAGNHAKSFTLESYVILNILGHLSVVLSGAELIFSIFFPSFFCLSVKRPGRLRNICPDLLIPYPQPLCLCEKLCVQNWGRCWALHVSLWPQQANSHKVGALSIGWLLCMWDFGVADHGAPFLSICMCGEILTQKRNQAYLRMWNNFF